MSDVFPPVACARCGDVFTDDNPAVGGLLHDWYCNNCRVAPLQDR